MDTIPLTVLAHLTARPGLETRLRELLLTLPEPTRKEQGCLNYDLHQSAENPALFLFHENWQDKAALDRHLASPHVQMVLSKMPDLVAEPPRITLWHRIG
jgi:quinol monooxygenase YgiN